MGRKVLTNARLVSSSGITENISVLLAQDRILDVVHGVSDWSSFDGEVVDCGGRYLSAGFIDLHCHGGGGYDFMDATPEAFIKSAEIHAKHGTTTILPTTLAGDPTEMCKVFEAYHKVKNTEYNGADLPGLHLEGPYFSVEYKGAQDEKYIRAPEEKDYTQIYDWSQGAIIRWSAAPELPGFSRFAEFLEKKGIIGSIAHTSATYKDVEAAFESGFKLITHLYSAMSSIVRKNGFRTAGVVESFYLIDGMKGELIADGCHLPAELLKLAYKYKGPADLILVTDAMRGAGMPDGESILGSLQLGQKVYIEKGVAFLPDRSAFAGSVCTADRLIRTMTKLADVPLHRAVQMLTETPANAMAMAARKGKISKGFDADIVVFDENIDIALTVVKGKTVFSSL